MAITAAVEVIESALWPQGDARDPIGVWGGRTLITGDASGGGIAVNFNVGEEKRGSFVYTCLSTNQGQLSGVLDSTNHKIRLLTNWPNIDPQAGVQGYNAQFFAATRTDVDFTGQLSGPQPRDTWHESNRYLLLFDPRPSAPAITLVQLEWGANTDLATYTFEVYGYYWDRSVLQAPGGPRHPGSG